MFCKLIHAAQYFVKYSVSKGGHLVPVLEKLAMFDKLYASGYCWNRSVQRKSQMRLQLCQTNIKAVERKMSRQAYGSAVTKTY